MTVALRKESVDRNDISTSSAWGRPVALRKESVDRNHELALRGLRGCVALRKESVDRNFNGIQRTHGDAVVALRKESVDRNTNFCPASLCDLPSLSARRAWIEIERPTT